MSLGWPWAAAEAHSASLCSTSPLSRSAAPAGPVIAIIGLCACRIGQWRRKRPEANESALQSRARRQIQWADGPWPMLASVWQYCNSNTDRSAPSKAVCRPLAATRPLPTPSSNRATLACPALAAPLGLLPLVLYSSTPHCGASVLHAPGRSNGARVAAAGRGRAPMKSLHTPAVVAASAAARSAPGSPALPPSSWAARPPAQQLTPRPRRHRRRPWRPGTSASRGRGGRRRRAS